MKKSVLVFFILIGLLIQGFSCGNEDAIIMVSENTDDESQIEEEQEEQGSGIGEARDITSFDLVAEMGVGWNLGNSFDVINRDKTFWGNPLPERAMIDQVAQRGFKTLRIPITWRFHQEETAPFEIEDSYLDRIKEVINYGFENRMHVIINVHHDEEWATPNAASAANATARLSSLWTQVAEEFEMYNDSLIFEVLNEPREIGIPQEWTGGTPEGRAIVNQFTQASVDAIRATGGNNELRHIMVPTWAASTTTIAMNDLVVPNNDSKVIISLHSYFPWPFAGQANQSWGSTQDRIALANELDRIRNKWIIQENRPVILGEWGSVNIHNDSGRQNDINERLAYAEFYASEASQRELKTIVWDDGGMFWLFDRHSLTWPFGNIADAIVNATEN